MQAALNKVLPPQAIQGQADQALDGLYAWLNGNSSDLSFNINTTDLKAKLGDALSQAAQERMNSLPACDPGQTPADFDPLTAGCVPPGTDTAAAAAKVRDQLNKQISTSGTLTGNDIKTNNGKTLQQTLQGAPKAFQTTKWLVIGLGIATIIFGIGTILLQDKRVGAKTVSIICIVIGALWIVSAALFSVLSQIGIQYAQKQLATQQGIGSDLPNAALSFARILLRDLRTDWLLFGGVLVVAGAITLIALGITRPKASAKPGSRPASDAPKEHADHKDMVSTHPEMPKKDGEKPTTEQKSSS